MVDLEINITLQKGLTKAEKEELNQLIANGQFNIAKKDYTDMIEATIFLDRTQLNDVLNKRKDNTITVFVKE